jgi:predicted DNA-binding antitoxin AbrB/MazE fold protein
MSSSITATFADGVFKPDEVVDLPTNARVQLVVQQIPEQHDDELNGLWEEFERLADEFPIKSSGPMPTRDQLHERR